MRSPSPALLAGLLALACAAGVLAPGEEPPRGRLPDGVRPLHYELELHILPGLDRFRGTSTLRVELSAPVQRLWLHGRDLEMHSVRVAMEGGPLRAARWEPLTDDGVAAVGLQAPLGPGTAELHFAWSAPFGRTLRGLYKVEVDDDAYAFTQFEPIAARQVFPGFDEPAFKTPFDVSLVVRRDHRAIATTPPESEEELPEGLRRIRFATTPKLPTYLLAWAVGPLDVVDGPALAASGSRRRAVPFRGIAARGRGGELGYALAHTPALVADLEDYFGTGYPYRKLDVIAVPDFGAGAMENVGAITFREYLLLLDPGRAPEEQRRGFTYVMAHELAHQWFGNLVTMLWWDDLWLNEAFATWLGFRSVERVRPEQQAGLSMLGAVHGAMNADSLVSARRILQPIASHHDIRNAFDAITYSKGAGVLGMFERWLGADVFRDGIRRYLAAHREGSARTEDLLAALSEASGRDVATPFASFLTQPGVPFVEARTRCDEGRPRVELRQSRYLPLGSTGEPDALWQVPVCVSFGVRKRVVQHCTLLDTREGSLALGAGDVCPDWVMPNTAGAGYYRFAQPAQDTGRLLDLGFTSLLPAERLALADALAASVRSGARPAAEVYAALPTLVGARERPVATAPMALLELAREHLADDATRPAVEAFGRELYRPLLERLGLDAAPDDDGETRLLRAQVVEFLARHAGDAELRAELARRARRQAGVDAAPEPGALEPELVETGLAVAVQEGGARVFDVLLAQLHESPDALARGQRLSALGHAEDPELAGRARDLALDPRLRVNEVFSTLWPQSHRPETRDATWEWLRANLDALIGRLGRENASRITRLAAGFCDAGRADAVEAFFAPRIDELVGGPRDLAASVEGIRLCAALVEGQSASARAFFDARD